MFKSKKWILFLIILFPSLFWVILETSTINSRKLPYYGPKKLSGKDTVYYRKELKFHDSTSEHGVFVADTIQFPITVAAFIKKEYQNEAFRISGFWEYANYKHDKIKDMSFVFVCERGYGDSTVIAELSKMGQKAPNLYFLDLSQPQFSQLNADFFNLKPIYVDYSFFILLDKKRHIRGYYDGRYVAEVKRLIDEYRHLRIKEEKQIILQENEIKAN